MRLLLTTALIFAAPVFASDPINLRNDREGDSYYSGEIRAINRALKQIDQTQITGAFDESIQAIENSNKLCSFDLVGAIRSKLKVINPKFSETEGALFYLRSQNEFDDIVTKLLVQANKIQTTDILLPKKREELRYPRDEKVVSEAVAVIGNFGRKLKNQCFDEAYRALHGEILRVNKDLKSYHIEALLVEAYQRNLITFELYLSLERARANELEQSGQSLRLYYKKIQSLRTQYPLRDSEEKSHFITKRADKLKMSYRQRLMEGYSDLQIMMMAGVIKKLRTRLESPKAEILIYDRDNGIETITLEPMERFRLAIKLLRKEMSLLALNTYFNGRQPDYLDLMAAAYEVGVIPASELEEVAGLKEIWSPTKTFWEKAQVWVRTLSSVATIAIPPPYGFIPALAVVVIEMTAGKKDNNQDDPTVLF